MISAMELPTRHIIHQVQLGLEEDIANLNTMWVCASCFDCTARCPRGVDIAKIMEALRLITLRKNVDYVELSDIPQEKLAEFPQIALVSCLRKLTA
jgi:heterodisulfide reductase subunit C